MKKAISQKNHPAKSMLKSVISEGFKGKDVDLDQDTASGQFYMTTRVAKTSTTIKVSTLNAVRWFVRYSVPKELKPFISVNRLAAGLAAGKVGHEE